MTQGKWLHLLKYILLYFVVIGFKVNKIFLLHIHGLIVNDLIVAHYSKKNISFKCNAFEILFIFALFLIRK